VTAGPKPRRVLAAVDAWQRAHAVAGFPIAVAKKFGDDRASSLAALMAYYAFLSMFPLLLVFVSVLGFVLEDDPSLQEDIVDTALARVPVIGPQISGQVEPLTGSGLALAIGIGGALWAGLGVTNALGRAFETVWDVPKLEQRSGLKARAWGIVVLLVLAVALIASTVAAGLAVGGALGEAAQQSGALLIALVVNSVIFVAVFGLLTVRPRRLRDVVPGAMIASAGSLALQAIGGWYVDRAVVNASDTYGTFALVIGLLSWFLLGAHLIVLAAEVNVVLHRRLWPRALTGDLGPADRAALERRALAARADERQEIEVRFRDPLP
jgi:membrane protein